MNSQRAVTTVLVGVMFIVFSVLAYNAGNTFASGGDAFFSLITVAAALLTWFSYLNNQIASGNVQAGNLWSLPLMPSWWMLFVGTGATIANATGFKFISAEQQTQVVDGIVLIISVVWYSFGDRLPGSPGQ